ncbi:MAG: SH3 domain-containing protein, partial [Planctomycetota bacterium]
ESNGKPVFSEVEVAGGFPVWVYGKYLQPSAVEDVMLVTGSRVNMRPLPNSTPASMPLLTKLDAGERVRFIERANKSVALGEDWVRIQAPSNAKAWLRTDALEPVPDAGKASAVWLDSTEPLPAVQPRRVAPASAPKSRQQTSARPRTQDAPRVAPAVLQKLVAADEAFDAASALKTPSVEAWSDVVDAYGVVLDQAPFGSVTREKAEDRLEQARVQMEFVSLREEFAVSKQRSDAEIRRIDRMLEARQKRKTARWGRYEERGWIEARPTGSESRWYLVFGGETVAEVRCLSGRYDLDVFEGYEIGVIGREIAPVVRATATSLPEARVVDAQRIEVISGRGRTR